MKTIPQKPDYKDAVIAESLFDEYLPTVNDRLRYKLIITFKDVSCAGITTDFVRKYIEKCRDDFDLRNMKASLDFLLFLHNKRVIDITVLEYIKCYCQGTKSVSIGILLYVIQYAEDSKDLDVLQEWLAAPKGFGTFCTTMCNLRFKDTQLAIIAEQYMDKLKKDRKYTIHSRTSNIGRFQLVISTFFVDVYINDISTEWVYNSLSKIIPEKYGHGCAIMRRMLLNFIDVLLGANILVHSSWEGKDIKNIGPYCNTTANGFKRIILDGTKLIYHARMHRSIRLIPDATNPEIAESLLNFCAIASSYIAATEFAENFSKALGRIVVINLDSLNFTTYMLHIQYFSKHHVSRDILQIITSYYIYLHTNCHKKLFDDSTFSYQALQLPGIAPALLNGFVYCRYNSFVTEIPESDRWIYDFSDYASTNLDKLRGYIRRVDFTVVQDKYSRNLLKLFFWYDIHSLNHMSRTKGILTEFLNYVADLRNGKVLTIFKPNTETNDFTPNEVLAYKQFLLGSKLKTNTIYQKISLVRQFFVFIKSQGIAVDTAIFYHLTSEEQTYVDDAYTLSDNDLNKLCVRVLAAYNNSIEDSMFAGIFYLLVQTEFRYSSIVTLKTNSIVEAYKKGQYSIISQIKNSNGALIEQPITNYTQRLLSDIIKRTREYRKNCTDTELNSLIFLKKKVSVTNSYGKLSYNWFTNHLHALCDELGIEQITASNLRDTHMTKAREMTIRKQISEIEENVLTGHSVRRSTENYVDAKIEELLESVHGIIIGNVELPGKIEDDAKKNSEDLVSSECGYCSFESCDDMSYLDCLLCKHFTTMPSRLKFFNLQIDTIDKKIKYAKIPHEIVDLVNIKRLLVAYKAAILTFMARRNLDEQ